MSELDKIIEKARKLMAMVEGAGTPAEAETAAAILNKLLKKHQLEIADISSHQVGEDIHEAETKETSRKLANWQKILMVEICDAFNCRALKIVKRARNNISGRIVYRHCFSVIGYSSDVEVVLFLYYDLAGRLLKMARRQGKYYGLNKKRLSKYVDSFMVGAAFRIGKRLKAENENMIKTDLDCRALVLMKDANIEKVINDRYPDRCATRIDKNHDKAGLNDGWVAGDEIDIRRAMRNSDDPQSLKGKINA